MSLKIIFVCYASIALIATCLTNAANHTELNLATAKFKPNFNLLTDIIPDQYDIHLTVETDADGNFNVYSGLVKISFVSRCDRDVLQFMGHQLNFTDIWLVNMATKEIFRDFNTVKTMHNYEYTDDIYLYRNDGEGFLTSATRYDLYFEYTGRIKQAGAKTGFFQSQFAVDDRDSKFVATHFQTKFIRDVIPTFEDISFKNAYNLSISHHPNLIALSNMPGTVTNHSETLATTSFELTNLMPGYLLAFAIGELQSVSVYNSRHLPFHIYSSSQILGNLDFVIQQSGGILIKFEEYLNVQYGLPKLDFLVLPQYEFAGMENWGLIVFKEAELYSDPNMPNVKDENEILILIAHEIAHQFFGNLVTPKEWRYVWLSEGFATYFSYKILNLVHPSGRFEHYFIYTNLYEVFKIDTGNLYLNPRTAKNSIYDVNNQINYCKASSIIRMIYHVVGETNFQNFITNYLADSRSVVPSDMIRFLEANQTRMYDDHNNQVNVTEFVESWIDQSGSIIVTAIRDYPTGDVKLSQAFNTMGKYRSRNTTWWIPYNYATKNNRNWEDTKPSGWLRKVPSKILNLNLSADEWIIFNKQHTGLYIVNYDATNWDLIINELNYGEFNNIHEFNRGQILHDLYKLVEYGIVDRLVLLRALLYLRHETAYLPWKIGSEILENLLVEVKNSPQEKQFNEMVTLLIPKIYADRSAFRPIRKIAIRWAIQVSYSACLDNLENLSNRYLNSIDSKSRVIIERDIINEMFCYGFRQQETWQNITTYFINHPNDPDILHFLRSIHCKPYTRIFQRNFMIYHYGLDGAEDRPKIQKAAIDHSIKQVESKNHIRIVYDCLVNNCYDFHEYYNSDSIKRVMGHMLFQLTSHATLDDLSLLKQILLKLEEKYSIACFERFNYILSARLEQGGWFRLY